MVRIKHRYLLVNILYPDAKTSNVKLAPPSGSGTDIPYSLQFRQPSSDLLSPQILLKLIRNNVADLFGDYGSGKVAGSLQIKYFSPATSTSIIRVSRDHYRLVWAALTFATALPQPLSQDCVFQVVRVSGTIRKAEEEAIRRARIGIRRAQRVARGLAIVGGEDEDVSMINGIEDAEGDGEESEDE